MCISPSPCWGFICLEPEQVLCMTSHFLWIHIYQSYSFWKTLFPWSHLRYCVLPLSLSLSLPLYPFLYVWVGRRYLGNAGQILEWRVHSPCFPSGCQMPLQTWLKRKAESGMNAEVHAVLSEYPGAVSVLPEEGARNGVPRSLFLLRTYAHPSVRGKWNRRSKVRVLWKQVLSTRGAREKKCVLAESSCDSFSQSLLVKPFLLVIFNKWLWDKSLLVHIALEGMDVNAYTLFGVNKRLHTIWVGA